LDMAASEMGTHAVVQLTARSGLRTVKEDP
jgi:hypothetical protein